MMSLCGGGISGKAKITGGGERKGIERSVDEGRDEEAWPLLLLISRSCGRKRRGGSDRRSDG